tara:strand:+ start:706 stop:882 length:177 start_codon:yes stop_codon:yes gene_type:complete
MQPQVFEMEEEHIKKLYKMLSKATDLYYSEITEDEEFEDFKILEDFVASIGRMVKKNN